MTSEVNKSYPFQVWLKSMVIAPILFAVATVIASHRGEALDSGLLISMILIFIYGLLFSIPAFIVYYFFFRAISPGIKSSINLRIILILIAVLCMLGTLFLLFGKNAFDMSEDFSGYTISLIYLISISISSFVTKIR